VCGRNATVGEMEDGSQERTPRQLTVDRHTTPPSPVRRPTAFPSPPAVRANPQPLPPPLPPAPRSGSILDRHPVAPAISITHERSITGELAEELWDGYLESVEPLAEVAVLRHLDPHDEMLAQFANPRILKLVAWQGDRPVGLGMVTNSLEDVIEISPNFLRVKYPDYAARDAIYVGMLVMVSPDQRNLTAFNRLYLELWQVPARAGGILVFDVCEFNRLTFDVDEMSRRIASNFPRASVEMLDRQTWYVAHLPEPLPGERHR
jgi:hypothetical protein